MTKRNTRTCSPFVQSTKHCCTNCRRTLGNERRWSGIISMNCHAEHLISSPAHWLNTDDPRAATSLIWMQNALWLCNISVHMTYVSVLHMRWHPCSGESYALGNGLTHIWNRVNSFRFNGPSIYSCNTIPHTWFENMQHVDWMFGYVA